MARILSLTIILTLTLLACVDPPSKNKSDRKHSAPAKSSAKVEKAAEEPAEAIDPTYLKKATALIENTNPVDIKHADAAKLFRNYCATCHGLRGNMEVNGSKDLTKTNTSIEERVAQIYFGKGLMTPFKGLLDDAEIIAVAKYLDELK